MPGHQASSALRRSRTRLVAAVVGVALAATACTGSSTSDLDAAQARVQSAQQAVTDAKSGLKAAGTTFCDGAKDYILAVDRYGKLFSDTTATVGDVTTLGADLSQPRTDVSAAAEAVMGAHDTLNQANQELADAEEALAIAQASASGTPSATPSPTPAPRSSSPEVPTATIDRVKQAETELETAAQGITDQTALSEATETYTSAAFALEVAWINLFADAGCLTDEQSQQANSAVRDYTTALQQRLKDAGYYQGRIDGVYGPETVTAVEALQTDAGLPVTGLVDRATSAALDEAVGKKNQSASERDAIEATAVQTTLKLAGYWPGAIDGQWTPELTTAVEKFQKDLGVEQTGTFDAATLGAIEELLSAPALPPTSPSITSSATP